MIRWIKQRCLLAGICALLFVPVSADAELKQAKSTTKILYLYGSVPPAIHQMRLSDIGQRGMSQFKAALANVGMNVTEARDADITLNTATLNRYKVLILGSNNRRFTSTEQKAVAAWVRAGGGLVAWSDSAFGGNWRDELGNTIGAQSDSDLTAQFGMRFLRDNGAGVFTIRRYEANHYLNDFNRNGGVVFRGEGVSLIRTQKPAIILARLQKGGSSGTVRLNNLDGKITTADAALAVARVGRGRVVGTFDRNTFWNAGAGTRLSEVDNYEYAQRLILWAANIN